MAWVRRWARREVLNRWRSLVALGILAGIAGGLAMAAVAGSRRTATADARYQKATLASNAMIFPTQLTPPVINPDFSRVRTLPGVIDAGEFALVPIGLKEYPQLGDTLAPADNHLFETIERPLLRAGRQMDPTRDDEVIVTDAAARQLRLHVGSPVTIISSNDPNQIEDGSPPTGGDTVKAHVVGIGGTNMFRVFDPSTGAGYLVSPGFLAHHPKTAQAGNLVVRLKPGVDLAAFRAAVGSILGHPDIPLRNEAEDVKRVVHGTDLERSGLLLFALAVALAGIVLVGQALTRTVYAMAEAVPTLRSFGATRAETAAALVLPTVVSAVVAAVVGVAGAIAVSSRFPVGLARQLEPDPGTHADWPVLAVGAVLVAATVVAGAAIAAGRVIARHRDTIGSPGSAVVRALRVFGSLPLIIGAGLALERGRGERSLPVRPAIAGATVGVLGVIGAFGLSHGIGTAATHPAEAGQVWQAIVYPDRPLGPSGQPVPGPHTAQTEAAQAARDPAVDGVVLMRRVDVQVNGAGIPAYSITDVHNPFTFVVLHGHPPAAAGDVVIGPSSAKALHVGVGGTVTVAGERSRQFRIVGIGLFQQDAHAGFDQGVWLTPAGLNTVVADDPFQDAALVTFRPGHPVTPTIQALSNHLGGVDAEPIQIPPDIIYLRNVRALPKSLAIFLALLGIAAVAHVLATAVRRRRHDLAVLRALGFRPIQVAACVAWQALTVAAVGLVIGVPLGIASGRWTWRIIADATPLKYVAPFAASVTGITVVAALAIAVLVASVPAWRAARLHTADVLRTE